jgi:hypothetical protein
VAVQNYLLLIRDARIAIYNKWLVGAKEKAIAYIKFGTATRQAV